MVYPRKFDRTSFVSMSNQSYQPAPIQDTENDEETHILQTGSNKSYKCCESNKMQLVCVVLGAIALVFSIVKLSESCIHLSIQLFSFLH